MATQILGWSVDITLALLSLAFLLTAFRVVRGPTLPDRVLALDMLVALAIGFMAVFAIKTGYALYIDIAIALALVGFLATVAFARFIIAQGARASQVQATADGDGDAPLGVPMSRPGRRR